MVTKIKILIYLSIFFIQTTKLVAQSFKVTIARDTVSTAVGGTFTNSLILHNGSRTKQTVNLAMQLPKSVQLLSRFPLERTLIPGETAMIPIKGLLNWHDYAQTNRTTIQVKDSIGHLLKTIAFELAVVEKLQVPISLSAPDETILLYDNTAPARLPLRLVHKRPRRETYAIEITSTPAGIDQSDLPLSIDLNSRQDTTLAIVIKPSRYWSTNTTYELILNVLDKEGLVLGSAVYKLVIAVANKRYVDTRALANGGYGASVGLTKLSDGQLAREARVWGSDSVGRAQMDFQVHYLDYTSDGYRQLQNSFIAFRTDRTMARLGSSYDFHELSLLGRGLKVSLSQPNQQWTFWAINANPNWLAASMNAWAGNVFSGRYDRRLPRLTGGSWSVSSSYFTQSQTMRVGYLNFASFRYSQLRRHTLEVVGGQSLEFAQRGNRAQTFGYAGQLNYAYVGSRFSFQLRSYLSNPVYSGIQKGATLLNAQLVWQLPAATTLLARVNHMNYNQTLFSTSTDYYRRTFGSTVAELNLTRQLRQFTLSLRPYWYAQSDFTLPSGQRAVAYRVAPTLSYGHRAYQHIDLSYDVGTFHNRSTLPPQRSLLSQRIVASVVMGRFSLWGYWQKGPYHLLDLQNSQPARIMTTSLTPMVDFALLSQRLIGSVGVNYLYDAVTTESRYVAVGRVQYDVTPTLSVRVAGYGTPYSQRPEQSFSQYRLDVTKRFNQLKLGHRGQLQLSFFEDANGNTLKDAGERWMDSLLVTVNENTLFTNTKGNITYRNLPPGTYAISAVSASRVGDPMLYQEKITVAQSVTKLIPLSPTFRVKGQLRCQGNGYDRQPCQFSRFVIDIQRDQQTISSTVPLPDGTFSVHLSPGTYTILVHDYGRQQQAIVKTTSFALTKTGQYPLLDWLVDASTRAVEVKRFKAQ